MEGPHITLNINENYASEEREDNNFYDLLKELEKRGESGFLNALRPLNANSSKARYVINQALLSAYLGWDSLLAVIDENDLKQELCGQILTFWSDRSDEENQQRVDSFVKKVAAIV